MSALVFPGQPHRRVSRRLKTWWGRAFWRAVEEVAYDETQILHARALSRSGRIGGLVIDTGSFAAGVAEEAGIWTVTGSVAALDEDSRTAFLEVVTGRADALLGGDLPHDLVEHAEEAGVELVPYGVELGATCTCPQRQRLTRQGGVCEHALGVLVQLTEFIDQDPLVLTQLRGISRADLRPRRAPDPDPNPHPARPQTVADEAGQGDEGAVEAEAVEIAVDAALRAARLLQESGMDPDPDDVR